MLVILGVILSAASTDDLLAAPKRCVDARDCASCAGMVDCQWCGEAARGRCIGVTDRSCPTTTVNIPAKCGAKRVDCIPYKDCAACAGTDGCDWCERTKTCVPDDEQDACPAGARATTATDCPVPKCSASNCASCVSDRHCGWCGPPASGKCVYTGENVACSPHASFLSECGGDAGAPAQTFPNTYVQHGILHCIPGSPDTSAPCQCPAFARWIGNAAGAGYGYGRWGHCECDPGRQWNGARRACEAPDAGVPNPCPPGMVASGPSGNVRCACAQGVWDAAQRSCMSDPCSGGARWDPRAQTCSCPTGTTWSTVSRTCMSCPAGLVANGATGRCQCPWSSPVWNATARQCEGCPGGKVWNGSSCVCEGAKIWNGTQCVCPAGMVLNRNQCVCTGGLYFDGSACVCPFRCGNGACLPADKVCNRHDDCGDGSDENLAVCNTPARCCVATQGCRAERGHQCATTCCCCPNGMACCADATQGCCPAN